MEPKQTDSETGKATEKKTRKRRPGEYRYQVQKEDGHWMDSAESFKGPKEALTGAGQNRVDGEIVRVIRVASAQFKVEAVTTSALKKIKQ